MGKRKEDFEGFIKCDHPSDITHCRPGSKLYLIVLLLILYVASGESLPVIGILVDYLRKPGLYRLRQIPITVIVPHSFKSQRPKGYCHSHVK